MSAQSDFESKYITTLEIMQTVGVSRPTVLYAKRTGKLPNPIEIEGLATLWLRSEVQSYLQAWKASLEAKRGDK